MSVSLSKGGNVSLTKEAPGLQAVNVGHVAPTVAISGASTVVELTTYTLALSATDPGHTVSGWSINWKSGPPIFY